MNMGGISGINYTFQWHPAFGCYVYAPKSQVEIDDILPINKVVASFPWIFSAMITDGDAMAMLTDPTSGAAAVVATIPPYVRPEMYANYPAEDLRELARNVGLNPQGDVSDVLNLRKQLDAYFIGRSWAIEEHKQKDERLRTFELERVAQRGTPAAEIPMAPELERKIADTEDFPTSGVTATPASAPATTAKADRWAAGRAVRSQKAAERRAAKATRAKELAPA